MDRRERQTLPRGGKARRVGGRPVLARQDTVGQPDQREVPMPAIPAPALIVLPPALALCVFIELLDGPAAVGQLDQPTQRGVRWQVTTVPLELPAFSWHRALAEHSAFRSSEHTGMAGGELRTACRPMPPHHHKLFAEDGVLVLAPRDRLPAGLWQGREDRLGRIQRCRGGFVGWPRPRGRGFERGGGHFIGQAYAKAAADSAT